MGSLSSQLNSVAEIWPLKDGTYFLFLTLNPTWRGGGAIMAPPLWKSPVFKIDKKNPGWFDLTFPKIYTSNF